MNESKTPKSKHAEREEKTLSYWKENKIFEKSLKKNEGGKEFVFYEGPPTANGHPGIHHLEARAFKDAIPRYKTMQGYYVRRKGGWDTHGLPVELQVEKELGLKSKKEIESYGIGAFNEKCKESVWKYVHEWEDFTQRMGYWVDLKDPYITYKPDYIESIWNIISEVEKKGLLYKDYKIVPWCPRCGTGLSSHELAQGYQDVKDLSVYVKFKVKNPEKIGLNGNVYLLAWTTTPWTLPGNVGLAVGEEVEYVGLMSNSNLPRQGYGGQEVKMTNEVQNPKSKIHSESQTKNLEDGEIIVVAKERLENLRGKGEFEEISGKSWKGKELIGLEYESLYPFLKDNISGDEKAKLSNAYKVYGADFVTTADGTGIVHTAVMYGQDDFELGTKVGLPKYHLVNDDGTFKKEADFLAGAFVKDQNTDVAIIKDLAGRGLLFAKEKYEHSYPHCWRCKTPLIYFARDSWYIRMSSLRNELVKENESINWEPGYIKEGRFGEWLKEIKDWAISRERYWGTPLPIWLCTKCGKRKVVSSVTELVHKPKNSYWLVRHGEAENNTLGIISSKANFPHHLTEKGRKQVMETARALKDTKFDLAIVSPFVRTKETFDLLNEQLGLNKDQIIFETRVGEIDTGIWNGRKLEDFLNEFKHEERFERGPEGGENYTQIKKRVGNVLDELEKKYQGKNVLIVSHETPLFLMLASARGLDKKQALDLRGEKEFLGNGEIIRLNFEVFPKNSECELDLHRPNIDEVVFECGCGGEMKRVKEVLDVWFDSGAMPFAQDHYPFQNKERIEKNGFPADFISEAIDQTRGWFYTLHAIGVLTGKGKAYKNVICLGHILDKDGKKMSKSLGNIVSPWEIMDRYGADSARFWMYSINQPGESKNFDEKTVDEIVKKVFNLASNVLSFYSTYGCQTSGKATDKSKNLLDRWILSRLAELNMEVTKSLDHYKFFEASRAIRDFIGDLSQWYIRRSRDRFKADGEEKEWAIGTTQFVLIDLAKIMAPLSPFFAEQLYLEAGGKRESVHLEDWPKMGKIEQEVLETMREVREISSKGLESRMSAKINVRQPLQKLTVKKGPLLQGNEQAILIVKDEVNVKEINFDPEIDSEVNLDTNITAQLKEEGMVRELIRLIQDFRKERGLTVNDKVDLVVDTDKTGQEFIKRNEKEISGITSIVKIDFSKLDKPVNKVGELEIKIDIVK